ncbi:MAG: MBL fold metallo-hydrolase [Candidatus Tectomicrobia bacterium]|uniref:MBL fold metallo-hydrolase n=1 Tax=Tectimicrobiota bacterium TaxID=2528274 RepID=A0A937W629_UNCTE|nr:MBL fold metallo-hydrolase [Candidatus Tectomicrobia bacterium]
MAVQIKHYRDMGAFTYGAAAQMTPLIRRVLCQNPTPFTYKGTGTYIVGTGQVAVIDPGPSLASHVDDILAALRPDEEITHIFITHTHSDHSALTARLQERTHAPAYGFGPHGAVRAFDPNDKVDFRKYFTPEEQTRFEREWAAQPEELKREGPDLTFTPDVRVCDGEVIAGHGWTLTAIHTPGHCSNHTCYHLREENALFSGDHVMGWATSVVGPPDGSMQDYLASLRKLLARQDALYWPTHGPAITEPRPYVQSFIQHREEREAQILAYLQNGPQQIADFVPAMYAGYDKRLWYPAANSVHAHMLHLVETGRACVLDSDVPKLTATYALA